MGGYQNFVHGKTVNTDSATGQVTSYQSMELAYVLPIKNNWLWLPYELIKLSKIYGSSNQEA